MNFKIIHFIILLFSILILCNYASGDNKIETPSMTLILFYKSLLSNENASSLPDIFSDSDSFVLILNEIETNKDTNKSSKEIVWNYLRSNKNLFLFVKQNIDPSKTIEKAGRHYLFSNFIDSELFYEGTFSIILTAPLDRSNDSTATKEIKFQFIKNSNPSNHQYLINIMSVTVNGFSILPLEKKYNNDLFYNDLGFRKVEKWMGTPRKRPDKPAREALREALTRET